MPIARTLLALGLVLGTGVALGAAPPANRNNQASHHAFHGVVVHVHHNKKGPGGTIRVLVRRHAGQQGKAALARGKQGGHIRTVRVTDATTFEKVRRAGQGQNKGQNAQAQKQPASFKDVHRGQHVRIKTGPHGRTALEVDIAAHAGQGKRVARRK
jgi:hypothetical protein